MRVLLFTGKGGVGKTTLAAATAARLAREGRKVLVASTDPAHSLIDALSVEVETPFGREPTELAELGGLFAVQIDTRELIDSTWFELREHLRTVLAGAGVAELDAEELTVLPGVEELLTLAEVDEHVRSGLWDTVIVDCGPTAETLRLLALPDAVATYLERLFPTHRRLVRGVLASLAGSSNPQRWDELADAVGRLARQVEAIRTLLTDAATTSVRLVLTPEQVVAAETRRTLSALALQGIHVDGLIANRLVPHPGSARGQAASWLRTRRRAQEEVVDELRESTGRPVRALGHHAREPIGVSSLLELADELYGNEDVADEVLVPPSAVDRMTVSVEGSGLHACYTLRIALELDTDSELDLARVGDELAVTVDGRRRLLGLPSVLRRCEVADAEAEADQLAVRFRPDPKLWMR